MEAELHRSYKGIKCKGKGLSNYRLDIYIENRYIYKMLTQLMQRDMDGMKVFLKRLVNAIGSSYVRLCLRLYLA